MAELSQIYKAFKFTPNGQPTLLLNGALESYDDTIGIRLASFEYLKRDGAEVEPMGAAQKKFTFRCVFLGGSPIGEGGPSLSPGSRYQALVQAIIAQPRGVLIHPRLGELNVACAGLRAQENPARAIDAVEFSIEFVEDSVDVAIATSQQIVPQQQGGRILALNADLVQALNTFASYQSAVTANVAFYSSLFTSASASFVTEALNAAQTDSQDLALVPLLGNVLAQQNALLASLSATLAFTLLPEISLTPYRNQTRQIYAECVRLYYAIRAQKPPLVTFTVPTLMPLSTISQRLYGKDARARIQEILLLNRVHNPFAVPGGTVLTIAAPVIRQ